MDIFSQKIPTVEDFHALTLISAGGCNLHCEYCNIAKSDHGQSKEYFKNVTQALKDGTYLNNVKTIMKKLNIFPSNIYHLELWGQEPTLNLNHLIDNLEDWFDYLPELKEISFSTNGVAHQDYIIDFITKTDLLIQHSLIFSIQWSYDGIDSTENLRGALAEKVLSNLENFILELNKIKLKNVKVRINIHGVLSRYLFNKLNTLEKCYNFYKKLDDEIFALTELNLNQNVTIGEWSPGIENPVYATTDEGLAFAHFLRLSLSLDIRKFHNKNITRTALYAFFNWNNIEWKNLARIAKRMPFLTEEDKSYFRGIASTHYCGAGISDLKIEYDGTLTTCQNHMFEHDIENIPKEHTIANDSKRSLITHNFFANPLKDSIEDVNKFLYICQTMRTDFLYGYSQIVGLMFYLAECRQIDESYIYDYNKILRHACILSTIIRCQYNNLVETADYANMSVGMIRFWANGVLDLIEEASCIKEEGGYNVRFIEPR